MPNNKAYQDVRNRINAGEELTLEMVGNVFGQPFWILLVHSLLDSQDAARAIQNAILRLSTEKEQESHAIKAH